MTPNEDATSSQQGASRPYRLPGKLAVITAAGAGIGAATSRRLAQEGAIVVAIDRSPDVHATAAQLTAEGLQAESLVLDCTDPEAVPTVFQDILRRHGRIDVLVNGVGQSARERMSEFWRSDPKIWDFVLDVCLKSTMLCTRQVAAHMRERRSGRVINISSIAWLAPSPNLAEYAAAKAGVIGFTRVLATELAPFGITVNAVSPGPIATAALVNMADGMAERLKASIPLGRVGAPEDIAAGIAYLASDDASFVTGHNLIISGGRVMA
jgi:NAD(P)-dependent dehydrogenase (short-subunit alcohol dehydrogenase family)